MNQKTEESLNTLFNIDTDKQTESTELVQALPAELVLANTAPEELSQEELDAKEDYEFSRGALKSVAIESQSIMHRAADVANQTDTPRAFEAAAAMVKVTLEAHQALQGLHKSAAENRMMAKSSSGTTNVKVEKGIVFAGTPDDLLRMIDPTRT